MSRLQTMVAGGRWFARTGEQVGLVPKSAYPESENSRNSDDFKQYLNSKLREFAAELRRRSVAGRLRTSCVR